MDAKWWNKRQEGQVMSEPVPDAQTFALAPCGASMSAGSVMVLAI
jgi:hypothetical protein